MGYDRHGNVVCDKCGEPKPSGPYAYCEQCMHDLRDKTWKVEEIFQDIEGDPDNVNMVIPPEVAQYLELGEGDQIRIQVTETGLILSKDG